MSEETATQIFLKALQYLMSLEANQNLNPPSGYSSQVKECKKILNNDCTGLIATTIEFIIGAISEVDFKIETDNKELNVILNKWLKRINKDKRQQIPSGFNSFTSEFCNEYLTSSMSIVRYDWGTFETLNLPKHLWVLDSANVKVSGDESKLANFTYKINKDVLSEDFLVRKDGRWYDRYPTPLLIRRGTYTNYVIKKKLKEKTGGLLDKLMWYLLLMKKGHPNFPDLIYTNEQFKDMTTDLNKVLNDNENSIAPTKIPTYATSFDTSFDHIFPDLRVIFDRTIYEEIDRDILAGLGLIEVLEGVGSTRREAILNPKPLVQLTVNLIIEIEKLLYELLYEIVEKNQTRVKYFSPDNLHKLRIVTTPLKAFWTEEFKTFVRSFYDRGLISKESSLEAVGFDFETELKRRENELKEGMEIILYPPVIQNMERDESTMENLRLEEIVEPDDEENIMEDKESIEKENFKASIAECPYCKHQFDYLKEKEAGMGYVKCPSCKQSVTQNNIISSNLEGSPYKDIQELPPNIKKSCSVEVQRVWMTVFNRAYDFYKNYDDELRDTISRKTAWKKVKKVAQKDKKGNWVLKEK